MSNFSSFVEANANVPVELLKKAKKAGAKDVLRYCYLAKLLGLDTIESSKKLDTKMVLDLVFKK